MIGVNQKGKQRLNRSWPSVFRPFPDANDSAFTHRISTVAHIAPFGGAHGA